MTTTTTGTAEHGVGLPGQAHAAQGPHDLFNVHVMHHAFRRDLAAFGRAAGATPVTETAVWQALSTRWDRFSALLHAHHHVEDTLIWPVVEQAARQAGDDAACAELAAMEAEHGTIDPLLAACHDAFAAMAAAPGPVAREALAARVEEA